MTPNKAPNSLPWLPSGEAPTTEWVFETSVWPGVVNVIRREVAERNIETSLALGAEPARLAPVVDVAALQARVAALESAIIGYRDALQDAGDGGDPGAALRNLWRVFYGPPEGAGDASDICPGGTHG